jgi:hypothetical protein
MTTDENNTPRPDYLTDQLRNDLTDAAWITRLALEKADTALQQWVDRRHNCDASYTPPLPSNEEVIRVAALIMGNFNAIQVARAIGGQHVVDTDAFLETNQALAAFGMTDDTPGATP